MSGAKRNGARRKGVEQAILDSYPQPGPDQEIVRVLEAIGGNLLRIETASHEEHLCRLPQRFARVVFVKRGSLLIATGCEQDYKTSSGQTGKVKFACDTVLFPAQIEYLAKLDLLPQVFQVKRATASGGGGAVKMLVAGDLHMDDDELPRNLNRRQDEDGASSEEDESDAE